MKEQGIKHNLKTYSMMINGFVKLKDWANAFAVFEDMVNDGMKPDVILYNNIIAAFCGMGNMERAVQTVKEMQKLRHRPTTRTFMPIIHGYAKSGDMRKSLEVFDMMRRCGCVPTVHTFNALINGLVEKRQVCFKNLVLQTLFFGSVLRFRINCAKGLNSFTRIPFIQNILNYLIYPNFYLKTPEI